MGLFSRFFGPPSKHEFARLAMNGIRQAGEKGPINYDKEQFCLGNENGNRLFLENGYHEYLTAPKSERSRVVQRFVRVWFTASKEPPEDFESVKADLLPVIRSRAYIELAQLRMQGEGNDMSPWPYQPLAEDLAIAIVYDLPEAMRSVTQDDLDNWGVSFYEALEVARHNLSELKSAFIGPREGKGVYLSATNDNYDASRLLLGGLIRKMQVKGNPVAMVPNRDTLIVAGSEDIDALKGMLSLAKDAFQKPRPISGVALRFDGDEWVPWLPETSHPLFQDFRTHQVEWHGQDYHDQKELLDKLHEQTNQDIFVASFSLMQNQKTGENTTFCTWAKDVLSFLPRTERIGFVGEGIEPKLVAWDEVVQTVGDLMEPLDMYPIRYRVSEFPTKEQLAAMTNLM